MTQKATQYFHASYPSAIMPRAFSPTSAVLEPWLRRAASRQHTR